MPKKIKKGKSKGKGKGKKGKKGSKKDKDFVIQSAIANAQLWESRLDAVEKAKFQYRENAKSLMFENEELQNQMAQTERDTVEVISFLKKEDIKKDEQIEKLQQMIKDIKREARKEKQALIDDYTQQMHQLQESLAEKSNEVKLMQSELKIVKEFRRKRAQMQKELDEIKDALFLSEKQHKETLSMMEHKFFEEKMRLQQEASKKIAELAEKAHAEAVRNLDETTKSVYKENVRLNEAIGYHLKETQELGKMKKNLVEENEILKGQKEMNSMVVEEKVIESKRLNKTVKELQSKVESLEKVLSTMIREFEEERSAIVQKSRRDTEQSKMEIARLQRTIELKSKEMNRVRKLAKNILDQRSEMEQFFLDSLEYVKNEIIRNRAQYRKDAQNMYNQKMLAAHSGQADYPKVRTFLPLQTSTNSVFTDLKGAEKWVGIEGKVDMKDLTWEQRERVLRLLFGKMNGFKEKKRKKTTSLVTVSEHSDPDNSSSQPEILKLKSRETGRQETEEDSIRDLTFITQETFDERSETNVENVSLNTQLPALLPASERLSSSAEDIHNKQAQGSDLLANTLSCK